MSPKDKKAQSIKINWFRRVLIGLGILLLTVCFVLFALRVWITTHSGTQFLEGQIENRQLGPIKRAEIKGLSGDPLDQFSIAELKLYDGDGVWLTAKNIDLDWSAWPIRKRHLIIEDLDVEQINILRRPQLEDTDPGKPFTARVDSADIAALSLDPVLIGQAVVMRLKTKGGLLDDGTLNAELDVIRTDVDGDSLSLDVTRDPSGALSGDFNIKGLPDGALAALIRAPKEQTITGSGEIKGTTDAGEGVANVKFNSQEVVQASVIWTPDFANIKANLNTKPWPFFDKSRGALGEMLDLTAALERSRAARPFTAAAKSINFDATASGELGEALGLPESIQFDVKSSKLGAILPLPDGYALGSGSAKGRANLKQNISGQATVNISDVVTPYGRAARISGPISLTPNSGVFDFTTKLTAVNPVTSTELPFELGQLAVLDAKGQFEPDDGAMSELQMTLISGDNRTTLQGRAAIDGSDMMLIGQVETKLKSIGSMPSGQLSADYALQKVAASKPRLDAVGTYRPSEAFSPPLEGLMGNIINFKIDAAAEDEGVSLKEVLLTSDGIRLAASGRVTDRFDLAAEVAVSQPINISSLDISAPSLFSVSLQGPRTDPNLRLDGTFSAVDVAGQSFEGLRIRTEISDLLSAPKGPVRLTAETDYGPFDFEAQLASTPAGYGMSDLNVSLAGVSGTGELSLDAENIVTGRLSLNLPQEGERYARAFIDLENVAGEQGVRVNAEAKDVAYQTVELDVFSANLSGTLQSLSGELSLEGQRKGGLLTREFGFDTPIRLTRSEETGYRLSLEPEADYGRYKLGHSEAVDINYKEGAVVLNAPLTLNGKAVAIKYAQENASETLEIRARDLPMNVLQLPGVLAESKGALSLNLTAGHSSSNALSGQAVIKVTDWRGFEFDEGEGLSSALTVDFQPQSVSWRIGTQDAEKLVILGDGRFPILVSNGLKSVRPDLTRPIEGNLNIKGSAKPLLSLLTTEDAEPRGQLEAQLDMAGTLGNPQVQGQLSGREIRLELSALGTRLRDGRFTAQFTNDTISVSDVYVRDTDDGTLKGGGEFKLGEYGRPLGRLEVTAKSFRALDRKDYNGQVSGLLYFESDKDLSTLGGDVTVKRAEVKQFVQGRVTVVEIEVEEINGQMDEIEMRDRPQALPIYLDLRVRAPRRIFVRTNGLDVELELDVTLKGTTTKPELFGSANVIRGGYRIAGKELEFTEGGVEFSGPLNSGVVNLKAETNTQNISAVVEITGTVEKPVVELSSTPDRPQDEILAALLFGRSVTELSTIETAQLAGALAQFSGAGGGFDLVGGLRDALGIGQLSIGVGEDGQATVSGGRYLAKDVYLQVFKGAGPESTGAVIDWEVQRNLFLRSKVQSDSQQSFSLKYKKDF